MLREYLFAMSPIHPLWAWKGSDNLAEQRALERRGFVREGTVREAVVRGGEWHDSILYGLLRREL
jgi:RimJ/RimL family protein N-acetyltransferase